MQAPNRPQPGGPAAFPWCCWQTRADNEVLIKFHATITEEVFIIYIEKENETEKGVKDRLDDNMTDRQTGR
jgi:hypothetical protein